MSLRLRLTLWYAAVLTGALTLFGGLLYFSLDHRLSSETDVELEGTATRFEGYFLQESALESQSHLRGELREFCQALPPGTRIEIHAESGFVFRYPEIPRAAGDVRSVRRQFSAHGVACTLDAAVSTAGVMHTLRLLRLLLVGLTPLVIAAASLGGAWLSRRALKPVHDIAAAARIIGIENLSARLPVPRTRDELADLTEVLNTMFERLERAVGTLSQFVADASHELRTPIAVIRTTAELSLRRLRSGESYRTSLEQIESEAERMTQLVEDLLTLARRDSQAEAAAMGSVELSGLVQDVCAEMAGLAELRRIDILAEVSPANVRGHHKSLHRLFLVLLDNAVKYSHPGGQVRIWSTGSPDRLRISVEDDGPGIDAENLTHIFQRFYRVDPSRTGAGHGLGLSLAESIALAHGATIEVESNPGKGSRFDVVFPVRAESAVPSGNLQLSPL